jgi:hypothetical protein
MFLEHLRVDLKERGRAVATSIVDRNAERPQSLGAGDKARDVLHPGHVA